MNAILFQLIKWTHVATTEIYQYIFIDIDKSYVDIDDFFVNFNEYRVL